MSRFSVINSSERRSTCVFLDVSKGKLKKKWSDYDKHLYSNIESNFKKEVKLFN